MVAMLSGSGARADVVTWDGSCGTESWWTCCSPSAATRDTNWDTGVYPAPNCPAEAFPGPGDDVNTGGATVSLDCCGTAEVKSFVSSGSFSIFGSSLAVQTTATYLGSFTVSAANLIGGQHFVQGGLTIQGPLGGLSVAGGALVELNSDTTWANGSLGIEGGATINNAVGRTFNVATDNNVLYLGTSGLPATFNNAGTFRKSAGSGVTHMGNAPCAFHNLGTVEVKSGTLRLGSNGTHSGKFDLASGSILEFVDGTNSLNAGAIVTGAGLTRLAEFSTVTIGLATVSISRVEHLSGTLRGVGDLVAQQSYDWTGGAMSDTGKTQIPPNGTLTISGNGQVSLTGQREISISGTAVWKDNAKIHIGGGGQVSILNSGVFDAQGDGIVDGSGTAPIRRFHNLGVFRKSGGLGQTTFTLGAELHNHGLVDVQSGSLNTTGTQSHTGTFKLAAGAKLILDGSDTFQSGTNFQGNGEAVIRFGTVNVPTGVVVPAINVTQEGGNLSGNGVLEISGTLAWSGGAMNDAGLTRIKSGAVLLLSGTNFRTLNSPRVLENLGTATWSGTGSLTGAGTLQNAAGALLDIQGSSSCSASVENAGTLRKSGGGLTQFTQTLKNDGTIEVLAGTLVASPQFSQGVAGLTVLNGGVLESGFNQPLTLAGGRLSGVGQASVHLLENTGATVAPGLSAGKLTITGNSGGNYTQGAGGTLEIELGGLLPGAQHDQLVVAGTATLDGTLRVMPLNGFVPQVGQQFTILTCGARAGTFASVVAVGGGSYEAQYSPTSVVLTVTAAPCPGDLNGDKTVNQADLGALLAAYGTCPGDPFYNSAAGNLAGDPCVTQTDLGVLLSNYGNTCP